MVHIHYAELREASVITALSLYSEEGSGEKLLSCIRLLSKSQYLKTSGDGR